MKDLEYYFALIKSKLDILKMGKNTGLSGLIIRMVLKQFRIIKKVSGMDLENLILHRVKEFANILKMALKLREKKLQKAVFRGEKFMKFIKASLKK
jgi:hypothetical protein